MKKRHISFLIFITASLLIITSNIHAIEQSAKTIPCGTIAIEAGLSDTVNPVKSEIQSKEELPTTQPAISITNAKMVSPGELGIAVNIWFPANSAGKRRLVKFNAIINGKPVEKIFDVTDLTIPEKENDIGDKKNGSLNPDTPFRINFKKFLIERFIKNENFELKAVAYSDGGEYSEESTKDVKILLPVVIVHGILGEFEFILGGKDPIATLKNFLIDNGYEELQSTYPTVYYFDYLSVRSCVADANALNKNVRQNIFKKTYARKINIIAHSMGGLISRYSIAEDNLPVNKLIMIGTPNQGATMAFTSLIDYQGLADIYIRPLKQLMPVYDYLYNFSGKLNKNLQKRFRNRFLRILNRKPLNTSTEYFSIFNSAFNRTPKEISVLYYLNNKKKTKYEIKSYGEGDNTVLAESAHLDGAENIDISDASETGQHIFLPANSWVLSKTKEILSNE